jgi:hypothetical protein
MKNFLKIGPLQKKIGFWRGGKDVSEIIKLIYRQGIATVDVK